MRKWLSVCLALAMATALAPAALAGRTTLSPTTAAEPDASLGLRTHPTPGLSLGGTATLLLSGRLEQTMVAGASYFILSGQFVHTAHFDLTSYLGAQVTAMVTPSQRPIGEQGPASMDVLQIWRLQGSADTSLLLKPAQPIRIMAKGLAVQTDVPPLVLQGRTVVPVRAIAEALGATVSWDGERRIVTVRLAGKTVYMTIGDGHTIIVDPGYPARTMVGDVPPLIAEGRTLIPVRFLSEALGFQVDWDAAASVVHVR